jgi:hypothetical protein
MSDNHSCQPTLEIELDLCDNDPEAFVERLNGIAEKHQAQLQVFRKFILTDDSINIEMVDGSAFEGPREPAEFVWILFRLLSISAARDSADNSK